MHSENADENWLEMKGNHIQGRKNSLNMLLLRSTNSMSAHKLFTVILSQNRPRVGVILYGLLQKILNAARISLIHSVRHRASRRLRGDKTDPTPSVILVK